VNDWFWAFVATEAMELPVYVWGLRRTGRGGIARAAIAFGASLLTHPVVWFGSPHLPFGYGLRVGMAEAGAVLAEAAWMAAWGAPRPLALALLANATSLSVGLACRSAFGWP
jgi:hypothetical protein